MKVASFVISITAAVIAAAALVLALTRPKR